MPSLFERITSFPEKVIAELKQINDGLAEIHRTYKSTQEKNKVQPVVVNTTLSCPKTEEAEDKRHRGKVEAFQDKYIFTQIAGLLVTLIIAAATFLSAMAAKDAASASNEQAKAAWKNIELTSKNIDLTVETFRKDQRAWIGPAQHGPINISPGSPLTIEIIVQNYGKTPALKFESHSWLLDHATGSPPNFAVAPRSRVSSSDVLYPGMQISLIPSTQGQKITAEQVAAFQSGKRTLYVFGDLSYNDVFGSAHRSTFCLYLEPTLKGLLTCSTYNAAN
ncbi:MAG TPA: hypothetical protein VGS27_20200 [Candidatus Sulfotelmatobacter sp.]|nr:hypothetical protein [Candidatus Sulfotelmatobacter sp.]